MVRRKLCCFLLTFAYTVPYPQFNLSARLLSDKTFLSVINKKIISEFENTNQLSSGQLIVVSSAVHSETEKKSKFLAESRPIATEEEAMQALEQIQDPKASHNCWAFRLLEV
jgi:hypothetical protein